MCSIHSRLHILLRKKLKRAGCLGKLITTVLYNVMHNTELTREHLSVLLFKLTFHHCGVAQLLEPFC